MYTNTTIYNIIMFHFMIYTLITLITMLDLLITYYFTIKTIILTHLYILI